MLSDIEIAQKAQKKPITEVAENLGIMPQDIQLYGNYKAKISLNKLRQLHSRFTSSDKRGRLILVTAITPTPAGEGKSTVSVGLGDGLCQLGKKAIIALREPSLGPCFGVKGGAAGGGYSQVVPMEEINLHFTGDIHAISIANNLISSIIDNHLQQGNELNLDPRTISWRRCVDLNDRALRKVVVGLGGTADGVVREDGFNIAVASEIMAIICLSRTISELKQRLNNIVIGQTYPQVPAGADSSAKRVRRYVRLGELNVSGAVAAVLKDALLPNLVQTLENTPAFIHGGPFANIAHGCNSINATLSALTLGDYVVTEAGFGADLGAEKFMDIKCRALSADLGADSGSGTDLIGPSAVVIVATIRALKMHGGLAKKDLTVPNVEALKNGFANLQAHIENIKKFGVPAVVAINRFATDTADEIVCLLDLIAKLGSVGVLCEGWEKGGKGMTDLAAEVVKLCERPSDFVPLYPLEMPLAEKIETLATKIYGASGVEISPEAQKKLQEYTAAGYGALPICMAKTQNSISHDKTLLGRPQNYTFIVNDVRLYAGAGFVVALSGDIMTMPGLPKVPAACTIDIDDEGTISGLF